MKQPSIFESIDFTHDSKKPIGRPDGTEPEGSISNQDNNLTPSGEQNHAKHHRSSHKKSNHDNKKDHSRSNDKHNKRDDSHQLESGSDPDEYDLYDSFESYDSSDSFGSFHPYSSTKRPDEPDDFDADLSRPTSSQTTFTLQFPNEQYRPTKNPNKPHLKERPGVRPNHQSIPNKRPDQYGFNRPDGSSSYNPNKAPSFTPDVEFGPTNRPAHRPSSLSARPDDDRYDYPNQTDMSSDRGKREPNRGDIGIQSLDEKGGSR